MNTQAGIGIILVVIVGILAVALLGSNGEENTIKRGTPSVVGEREATTTPEDTEPETQTPPVVQEVVPQPEPQPESEETQVDPPSLELDAGPSDDTVEESTTEEEQVIEEPAQEETTTEEETQAEEEQVETEAGTTTEEQATSTEEVVVAEPEPEPEPEPVLGDLLLHLPLNEGSGAALSDVSGYGNVSTLLNADETAWQTGKLGGAVMFDGIDSHIDITHSDSLNLGAVDQSYTITFWFRSPSKPSGERQLIGKGGRSGPSPFIFRIDNDGDPSFRISDGLQATTISTTQTITGGTWHHIAGVRDVAEDKIFFYIDGSTKGPVTLDTTTGSLQNTLDIFVNKHDAGGTFFYDQFTIDDIRIYNRALPAEEVRAEFLEAGT